MKTNLCDDALHPDHRKDASGGRARRIATPRARTRPLRKDHAWSDNGVRDSNALTGQDFSESSGIRIERVV